MGSMRRVVLTQVVVAGLLVAAVVAYSVWSNTEIFAEARAKSLAFGALLGILVTLVTARSVLKSSRVAEDERHGAHLAMLPIYAGLLFKLVIVAGGTFFGLAYLRLAPLYIVLGYIAMQAGYFCEAFQRTPRTPPPNGSKSD